MTIWEPATTVTDYVLALVSLLLFYRLRREAAFPSQLSVKLWAIGFLVAALAAAVGGTFHGFGPYFVESIKKALWNVTVFLLGACSAFMIAGTLTASIDRRSDAARSLLLGLAISLLGLSILAIGVRFHRHFNHNDIYHCIQIVAFYFFYRGARQLRDRSFCES